MAIWLIRAGGYGEYEQKFIQENRVYVTWDKLATDLSKLKNRTELFNALAGIYENAKPKKLHNWVSQIWPFAHEIKTGDLVILPLKAQRAIQIGEITGDYNFVSQGPNPFTTGGRSNGSVKTYLALTSGKTYSIPSAHL